jgi:thioredoxin-related protein
MKQYNIIKLLLLGILFFIGCETKESQSLKETTQKSEGDTPSFFDVEEIAGLDWYIDVDKAFEAAQKQGKNVIIMIGEDYCRYCTNLKEKTLTDKRVESLLSKYIRVSLKRSDKPSLKVTPEFDGNIPSLFFLTPKKKVIDGVVGYYVADDFVRLMQEIEESGE